MTFLKTSVLMIGETSYTLTEFTGLDRIHDLEHAVKHELIAPEDPDPNVQREYMVALERHSLTNMAHSIALSLRHAHPESLEHLSAMVAEQWPSRALNAAYGQLVVLNQGDEVPTEDDDSEPAELGKSWSLRGTLRTILRLS